MENEKVKRYSQAFKQQVVREYESGSSINTLRQKYGIGGHHTVKEWIVQSVDDQENMKALKRRIGELESALASSVLENHMLQTTLTVASSALGMDIKKNFGKRS